jgi:anhydro-N-acetylmuramic acid kinase
MRLAFPPGRLMRVLGCMSGTSLDGIDIACADLEVVGDDLHCRYLGLVSSPFDGSLRDRLVAAMPPCLPGAGELCELHADLGDAYAAAFADARDELGGGGADLAVLHGQTFYHWVDDSGRARGTLQLGDPGTVAERLGVPVVADLRSRDIAAGGQGAPLVPFFDALLLADRVGRCAAVNLGGIANLTVVDGGQVVVAYDVGPAGAVMDPAAEWATAGAFRYDTDGTIAARGRVCEWLLDRLKGDPYYRLRGPRSTGKEHFNADYLRGMLDTSAAGDAGAPGGQAISDADVVATVTRLLVDLLADAALEHQLAEVVISGGGSRNATVLRWLRAELPGVRVCTTSEFGIPVQAKEALAFALLGFLSWNGLPGSVTAATGARHPSILGSITPGAGPLVLPPPLNSAPSRMHLCDTTSRDGQPSGSLCPFSTT